LTRNGSTRRLAAAATVATPQTVRKTRRADTAAPEP
jgi:hypothetical protein